MGVNLLTDPVFRLSLSAGRSWASLPEVYAALAEDAVQAFPALRPHQRHAWHAFLCQLGAIALRRTGAERPPEGAEAWRELLRALTPEFDDDAPWQLVVEDASRPAFLQPPAPGGDLTAYRARIDAADTLDVLVTARNFDVKAAVAADAEVDDWLFALIDLQTMEGFLGAGNYGIARMNGGFSARPFLGLAPAAGAVGAHVMRDIVAMLAARDRLAEVYGYPDADGLSLLWLLPWDGVRQLGLDRLDPYFIEVCRRVRLGQVEGRLFARAATTKAARIAARAASGVTGDFWAPVHITANKAFSLPEGGFSARRLTALLGEDYELPPALLLTEEERQTGAEWLLVARGLARGQGKTEGWHERIVPLRPPTVSAFRNRTEKERLGTVARTLLDEIAHISKALGQGCAVVAAGGDWDGVTREDRARAMPYQTRLEAEAEAQFFESLQDRFAAPDDAATRISGLSPLIAAAERLLAEAAEDIPCPAIARHRARARARRGFWGTLWSSRGPLADDRDALLAELKGGRDVA